MIWINNGKEMVLYKASISESKIEKTSEIIAKYLEYNDSNYILDKPDYIKKGKYDYEKFTNENGIPHTVYYCNKREEFLNIADQILQGTETFLKFGMDVDTIKLANLFDNDYECLNNLAKLIQTNSNNYELLEKEYPNFTAFLKILGDLEFEKRINLPCEIIEECYAEPNYIFESRYIEADNLQYEVIDAQINKDVFDTIYNILQYYNIEKPSLNKSLKKIIENNLE